MKKLLRVLLISCVGMGAVQVEGMDLLFKKLGLESVVDWYNQATMTVSDDKTRLVCSDGNFSVDMLKQSPDDEQGLSLFKTVQMNNCSLLSAPAEFAGLSELSLWDMSFESLLTNGVLSEKTLPLTLTKLGLRKCGLRFVPVDIKSMGSLKSLNLSSNPGIDIAADSLPENLAELHLNRCELSIVPVEIKKLKHLKKLSLVGNNELKSIKADDLPGVLDVLRLDADTTFDSCGKQCVVAMKGSVLEIVFSLGDDWTEAQ